MTATRRPGRTGRHDVMWCFHATAMVTDYERTRDALAYLVGSRALEDNRLDDPAIGRRGGMTWIGDNSIELGESIVPGGAVDQFVSRFGSHMSSFAVQVEDTDATIAFLEANDVRVVSRVMNHIVFTSPKTTAGVVIEWFGDESENDPRFGTVIPPYSVSPLLDVRQMASAGAVVRNPTGDAARLAHLFGTRVSFADPDAAPGRPQAGVDVGDMTLALYAIESPEVSQAMWGHTYTKPQTANMGVRVPNLSEARAALTDAGVKLVRSEADMIVIHPDETGGVVLVVTDQLLPGDPRS
jgi:hypothetical protein